MLKNSKLLLTATSLILACQSPPPGTLVQELPRLTPETSCRQLSSLDTIEGQVTAWWTEYPGGEQTFLGRSILTGDGWSPPTEAAFSAQMFGTFSVSPEGVAVSALHNSTAQGPFDLHRFGASGWETVPFDPPLDWTRQNFPQAVALDEQRMVVNIWESHQSQYRQRAFLLQGDSWVPLEEYQSTMTRTFHRGASGALWRAVHPTEVPGVVRFESWNGSSWNAVGIELAVTQRGYLRHWAETQDGFVALWDTTTTNIPGSAGFTLFKIVGTTVTTLATGPSDLAVVDLAVDSLGRVAITLAGYSSDSPSLRVMALEGTGWRSIYELSHRPNLIEFWPQATIQGEDVYVGWSESTQPGVDTGFGRYTDCTVHLVQVPLTAP